MNKLESRIDISTDVIIILSGRISRTVRLAIFEWRNLMNKRRTSFILIAILVFACFATSAIAGSPAPINASCWQDSPELNAVFASANVTGTFVLYDTVTNSFIGHNRPRAETRFVPASTFKITNTLIGLTVGSVADVDTILPFGGKPQPIKSWERDMNLREAMPISNIPIYQELARRTGLEKMRTYLALMQYGNQEPGDIVDRFWLDGPIQISAVEQTLFLAALAKNKLPLTESVQAATREIMLLEQGDDWILYGKTGTATCYPEPLGWWVGWVEKSGIPYVFALNIDMPGADDARKRVEIGKTCLKILGILFSQ